MKIKLKDKAITITRNDGGSPITETWYYLSDIPGWIRQKYLSSRFGKKRRDRGYEAIGKIWGESLKARGFLDGDS